MYIREAHAVDSKWPIRVPTKKRLYKAKSMAHRVDNASQRVKDLNIEWPTLVDDLENSTEKSYDAWPDRLFIVDSKGRIALRAARGPFGFPPAVKKARLWLEDHARQRTQGR